MDDESKTKERLKEFVKDLEFTPRLDSIVLGGLSTSTLNSQDVIFRLAIRSKFRRTKIDAESQADLKQKIGMAYIDRVPIEFSVPFGGYKNYRLPSFPECDWAEVFNLRFIISYLLPIAEVYTPGVILSYSYNSQIMHRVSNLPLEKQRKYEICFLKLIEQLSSGLPQNLKIRTQQINQLYESDSIWEEEFAELFKRNEKQWDQLYDASTRDKKMNSARHNLILDGELDLTGLSRSELEEEYLKSAMMCDALDSLSKRRCFNKQSNRIQLVFIGGPKQSIHIGSCAGSTVHFWTGIGVAEVRKDRMIPTILTFEQLMRHDSEIKELEIESSFAQFSKNFSNILFRNSPLAN